MTMAGWLANATEQGAEVLPLDDVVEHSGDDCVCGPTTEPVAREDGSYGWLVTHHSLDGREWLE
jgi:hypothetical protein